METLADTLAENVAGRVCLHDLGHGLLDERLEAGEPVAVGGPQVVCEVHTNHDTGRRGVDTHRVGDVVEELGASVPLDVVSVEISPTQLNVDPELVAGSAVKYILTLQRTGDFSK